VAREPLPCERFTSLVRFLRLMDSPSAIFPAKFLDIYCQTARIMRWLAAI
jgi:hypothetical protein